MPVLQVRDLPEEIYEKLSERARLEHRSLAQETIVLLREVLGIPSGNKDRRRAVLSKIHDLGLRFDDAAMPNPVDIVREGREER